mgnify:CR=1 FL=1
MDLKLAFYANFVMQKKSQLILVKADFVIRMEEKCLTSKLGHTNYLRGRSQTMFTRLVFF